MNNNRKSIVTPNAIPFSQIGSADKAPLSRHVNSEAWALKPELQDTV